MARAASLGWKPPRAQRILCGPELRTRQTAQALGLPAIVTEELRDCGYGFWGGKELRALQDDDPEGVAAWLTDPAVAPHGGESIASLMERVGRWMEEEQRIAGHTIAVTHPAVIRCVVLHVLQSPAQSFWRIDVAPLSLTDLRFNGRAWTLRSSDCALCTPYGEEDAG